MTIINWLHLSDWHQHETAYVEKQRDSGLSDREVVTRRLIEDVRDRAQRDPALADLAFVVFSGDAAFAGQAQEYTKARELLFDPLLQAAGLTPQQLILVPGNHDFDRTALDLAPAALRQPLTDAAAVTRWQKGTKERARLLDPFEAYATFAHDYAGATMTAYISTQLIEVAGLRVGLLGLNSALLCGRHTVTREGKEEVYDYGYLILGEPQVRDGLAQLDALKPDLRIGVVHHPFEWLQEFDRVTVEPLLQRGCHFLLRGHIHRAGAAAHRGTTGDCVILPSGASYEKRDRPTGYSFVSLDLTKGTVRVSFRRWSEQLDKWTADTDIAEAGGVYTVDRLPEGLQRLVTPPVPPPPPPPPAGPGVSNGTSASTTPSTPPPAQPQAAEGEQLPAFKDALQELLAILAPQMRDTNARWALIERARFPANLVNSLQLEGETDTVIINLQRRLRDYGSVSVGRPAIIALLDGALDRADDLTRQRVARLQEYYRNERKQ